MSYASYTQKPQYGWDARKRAWYTLHPEARQVTSMGVELDLALRNVPRALSQSAPLVKGTAPLTASTLVSDDGVPLEWQPWLGEPLSSGAYGVTFRVRNSGAAAVLLDKAQQAATFAIRQKQPAAGDVVIVKVARDYLDGGRPVAQGKADEFATASVKEASWHRHLDTVPCMRVPGLRRGTCPAEHVPDFFWAGMVVDTLTSRRFYVTVMALAPGVTLNEYLKGKVKWVRAAELAARQKVVSSYTAKSGDGAVRMARVQVKPPAGPLTSSVYLAVERAVALMWLNGVVHADFHKGNTMYDAATGRVTIIDFGQGVGLPRPLREKLLQAIVPAIAKGVRSLGELWDDAGGKSPFGVGLQAYTNRVRYTRDRAPWYNPDGHALKQLFKLLPRHERAAVQLKRPALWGVATQAAQPTQPTQAAPFRPTQVQQTSALTTAAAARLNRRLKRGAVRSRAALDRAGGGKASGGKASGGKASGGKASGGKASGGRAGGAGWQSFVRQLAQKGVPSRVSKRGGRGTRSPQQASPMNINTVKPATTNMDIDAPTPRRYGS
jgi:hypothetical protein